MNERIRELYEQARLQAKSIDADLDRQGWMDLYHQKFAELIVRECLNQCYNRGMNDELYAGQLNAAWYIEQHFGVEE
jgi:hypothetical protein